MTPALPRELVRKVGIALYGTHFAADMARALGVSDRTVRAWCSGRMNPRPGVWEDLLKITVRRHLDLVGIIDDMSRICARGAQEQKRQKDAR